MSKLGEHRRVPLTTISSSHRGSAFNEAGFNAVPPMLSRFGDFLDNDAALQPNSNKSKSANKTVRLQLELFETDSYRYPEFNYSKLLHLEKKKAKMLKEKAASNGNNNDPFADNDDDVARIAKELEAKYGNSYARGRGRRKKDDFADIGMGYDESDSFIDNTEAYDEILPEEVETLEGGFYINSGALEFKNLIKKSNTRRTDAIIKMPERSRKRVVSTSSDDSSETSASSSENEQETATNNKASSNNNADDDDDEADEDDDDDEEDDDNDSESESESIDGSDSDTDSIDDDEESAKSVNSNAKNKFKQNAVKLPKSSADAKARASTGKKPNSSSSKLNVIASSSSSNSPRPIAVDNSDTEEQRQAQSQAQSQALKKVVKTTTVKDMLKAKRDSFLKSQGQVDGPSKSVVNGEVKCTTAMTVDSSSDDDDSESASEQGKHEKISKANDNQRTADTILPATLEKEILANINSFKEMVRARELCGRRFDFDSKLTALLLKIYEALLCSERNERNMVFAHLEYQLQLPKYFILRRAKALRAREEKNKTTVALEKLRKAVAELMPKAIANYEIELHRFAELAAADVNSEHPPKMPRKKFQWNNELRERLYDVYQARWTSYAVLGRRKDSLEQFINGYLKDKVVEVWATGWMRYEELQREIERHKHASKKQKEKVKKVSLTTTAATATTTATTSVIAVPPATTPTATTPIATTPIATAGSNYVKQYDELTLTEQSRSRANSDTDSATSASSNSLKRKLELPANNGAPRAPPSKLPTVKPPKIKFQKQLEAKLAQMSQSNSMQQMQAQTQAIDLLPLPAVNNYLKQLDDLTVTTAQSRSRANSDTDSVASASSNSLKRKPTSTATAAGAKQPKKKNKAQQQQQPLTQLNNLMVQPSTSAQAAAMMAAVEAAAASMLELASPTKQTDHSINSIMTAANLSAINAINSNTLLGSGATALQHSTAASNVVAASTKKPLSHVINLDNYKSPSEILHTSQQLAANNKWQTTTASAAPPPAVVRCESSSESDGVEIVCVYPAAVKVIHPNKPARSKGSQKSKATSVISTTGSVANGLNGVLGSHHLDKAFTYGPNTNNNNNNNGSGPKLGAGVIRTAVPTSTIYADYSRNTQLLKTLSDLTVLEKLNAAAASGSNAAAGGAASAAGRGTTSSHQ
ncbi:hypothetical protein KR044_006840 [Drosophila immigrans]|nr:hypothetical protein KR044_006840 [Drosophila immigrans]